MPMSATPEQRDGRTVRAERTRQALVDSLLALLDEGHVRPTAAQIAARAGVSERSVFQHFPDREALFEAVARQQYERIVPTLRPIDTSLPLPERIEQFAAARAPLRADRRRAPGRPADRARVVVGRRLADDGAPAKAAEVERVFSRELDAIPADERDAAARRAGGALRLAAWESWRVHQRLSVARARAALAAGVAALLGQR